MSFLEDAETLGDAFRAARQASGRSLNELSAITKVPPRFLTALEEGEVAILPSRVFALGYVRSYAMALGLDEQTAIERFKRETPDPTVPLQAPIGAQVEDVRRNSSRFIAAAVVVVIAVIGWNVFQRIIRVQAPHPSDIAAVPRTWASTPTPEEAGGVQLGAPRPAPADQTVPALYITPGLEAELTGIDPTDPAAIAAAAAAEPPVQAAFNPRGAIYGSPAISSQVVLQARKPAALVVRLTDGRVLFARQLAAGEAWRAPLGVAATVDVSDPAAFDVYFNGEHGGGLTAVLTPLAQLNTQAASLARQSAEAASRAQAARLAAQAQRAAALAAAAPAAPPDPVPSPPVG